MLRALLAEASPLDRIITIELSYELGLHELAHRHPDCPAWETREANTEGEGAITMDQLVQRANRHNADRVVVGEVLGDEIVPMLNAMTAGKDGSMCTIHADSTEGTFGRIQSYASQSPKHLSDEATAKLTAQALDLVVFVRQQPAAGGFARRYVSSIRVVEDSDGPHVISTEIFAEPDERRPGRPPLRRATGPPGPPGQLRLRSPHRDLRAMTVLIVICSVGIGVGIALAVTGLFATTPVTKRHSFTKRIDAATRQSMIAALVCAAVVGLATHWPVGAAIGGAAGWTLRSAVTSSPGHRVTNRLDALATWIESLRDSVAAQRGLVAAIESTVPSAPASLRTNIEALVVRIKSGTPLDRAFAALASELADASADEAIAPLILASRFGGTDLQNLLGTAAANTREQLALVQRTEVARAKPRREMRLVVVVTLGFVLATLTIGHGYFAPFSTTVGQIVLLVIAALFAVGFASMHRLSRPQAMPRLYKAQEQRS